MAEPINESTAMMSVFRIEETPEKGIYTLFGEIEKDFHEEIRVVLDAIAPRLADKIRENFDMKGKREGHAEWDINKNPTPLIDRGNLYKSIEGIVQEQGDNYSVIVGTNLPYAKIHNEGGTTETDVVFDKHRSTGSYWIHTGGFRTMDIPKREFLFFVSGDLEDNARQLEASIDTMDALKDLKKL